MQEKVEKKEKLTILISGQGDVALSERDFTDVVTQLPEYDDLVIKELKYGLQQATKQFLKDRYQGDIFKVREQFNKIWK